MQKKNLALIAGMSFSVPGKESIFRVLFRICERSRCQNNSMTYIWISKIDPVTEYAYLKWLEVNDF